VYDVPQTGEADDPVAKSAITRVNKENIFKFTIEGIHEALQKTSI
jgi:hypothetical protein